VLTSLPTSLPHLATLLTSRLHPISYSLLL
jgi:hypothetical protein